jgi:protein involved in polysaccharide export with SLBB domain
MTGPRSFGGLMKAGLDRPWERTPALGLLLALLAGCASGRSHLERALLADRAAKSDAADPAARYALHCPDVLEFTVVGRPECSGARRIGADGRVELDEAARVRADGRTAAEVARAAADQLGLTPGSVQVRVSEFNSQQIYVFGEVVGLQRAVPYRGEETALELLQRVGGLSSGAALGDVQVVRANVAEGRAPEVYHVDLDAILLKHDPTSNVRLEPFDQVFVGQSSQSRLKCCFPPWLRPSYDRLCGLGRRQPI